MTKLVHPIYTFDSFTSMVFDTAHTFHFITGTLPSFEDGNKSAIACMQTHSSVCEHTFNIVIRNCDGYYVYFLPPTPPNSSYCFGNVLLIYILGLFHCCIEIFNQS